MLPPDLRGGLCQHPHRASLLEVVLDLGRRPEARFLNQAGGEVLRERPVDRRTHRPTVAVVAVAHLQILPGRSSIICSI